MLKRLLCLVMTAVMLLCVVPGTQTFAAETGWNSARELTENLEAQFTIPTEDTVLWYKVRTTKPDQTVKLTVNGYGVFDGTLHYTLYDEQTLLDGTNMSIGYDGEYFGHTKAFTNNFKMPAAGIYYIKIYGEVNETPLNIRYSIVPPDAHENNDSWKNATVLPINTDKQFTITSDSNHDATKDTDWFKITVPADNDTIKLTINNTAGGEFPGSVHYTLYNAQTLLDGANIPIGYDGEYFGHTQAFTNNFKMPAAGIYYLKVYGSVNETPLNIRYTVVQPDAYENNDSWKNATPAVANTGMQFTITSNSNHDETRDYDWYKVLVPSGNSTLRLTINSTSGSEFGGAVHFTLYDEQTLLDGTNIQIGDDVEYFGHTQAFTREFQVPAQGTYYIKIFSEVNEIPLAITSNHGYPGGIIKKNSIYVYDAIDPGASVVLPADKLKTVTDKASAASAIQSAAAGMTAEQKQSPTGIDLITLYAEEAAAQAATRTIEGNDIVIDQNNLAGIKANADEAKAAAEQALINAGITAERSLDTSVKFTVQTADALKITVDPSATDWKVDNVRIETPDYGISLSTQTIKANTGDSPLIITVTANPGTANYPIPEALASIDDDFLLNASGTFAANSNGKTYTIKFSKPLTENVKVSLMPATGNTAYQAVTKSDGTAVGGKFNPATGKLEVKIKDSDTYSVKENKKSFSDIITKSKEMQDAILILSSKGIIGGTSATTFSPDSTITRAEIAALIVRTLSKLDPNANGGFSDVRKTDWYYGAVGSAKQFGIINGTSAATFTPKASIKKDHIVAVCARTLKAEMNYRSPGDVEKWLSVYTDRKNIPGWGTADIALATRENLVVKRTDGRFNPADTMTRGDAAIILYRMFMKIW